MNAFDIGDPIYDALELYQGKAYRGSESLPERGKTAADLIRYERDELGNSEAFKHITPELEAYLNQFPHCELICVTRTIRAARHYGECMADVYEVYLKPHARILANDGGDGGFLLWNRSPIGSGCPALNVQVSRQCEIDFTLP